MCVCVFLYMLKHEIDIKIMCKHIYKFKRKAPPVGARDPALARACPGPGPWGCFSFDFINMFTPYVHMILIV